MKFTAKASTLAKELAVVAPLAGKRQVIPVLGCVLIRANDGLTLTTTDAESMLSARVSDGPFAVAEAGSLCVDAKRLSGIVGSFKSDAEISFRAEKDDWLSVECGGAKLRIPGIPAQDFPVMPDPPPDGDSIEILGGLLAEAIRKTAFAAGDDRGMRITVADNKFTLEATNGNHASTVTRSIDTDKSISILAEREAFDLIAGLLKDVDLPVRIQEADGRVWVAVGERSLRFRTKSRPWSDLALMVSRSRKTAADPFKVERQELLAGVRRAELSAPAAKVDNKGDGATGIEMTAAEGALTLKAEEQSGQATERLPVNYHGPELEGRYSSVYLRQFLAVASDQIQCRLNKAKDSAVHFLDESGHEYVLMGRRN